MKRLPVNALNHFADTHRTYRHVVVPNDTLLEELLTPGYWSNVANVLRRNDLLDVVREDLSLDVQFRVVSVDKGLVLLRPRMQYTNEATDMALKAEAARDKSGDVDEAVPAVPDGYKVGYVPARGHYVQLKANQEFIFTKQVSKRAAIQAAIEHAKKASTQQVAA